MNEITPKTFIEVAEQVQRGDGVQTESNDDGFILKGYRQVFVGYHMSGNGYIVARIVKRTSTINRNEPKLQTQKHTTTRAEFRRLEFDDSEEIEMDLVEERFGNSKQIDTGYINPYRVTPLREVVEDIFKWYSIE